MSTPTSQTHGPLRSRAGGLGAVPLVTVLYLLLAVAGLAGTWYFNLRFSSDGGGQGYLQAWFANSASSSAAVDVTVTAVVACVFYLVEGRRLGIRRAWVLVPLTFLLALAFTLPVFLAVRERALARRGAERSERRASRRDP